MQLSTDLSANQTSNIRRLGIGTVQFGQAYGITNKSGRPSDAKISLILEKANKAGISLLDTAQNYGSSEDTIGRLSPPGTKFDIVSKISPNLDTEGNWTGPASYQVYDFTRRSLDNLRTDSLYGLLLHNTECLSLENAGHILEGLARIKEDGLAQRVGFSAYNAEEIDQALSIFKPDLIQVPTNILDQRLHQSGHLKKLKEQGIEIHIRSLYLQGLLLLERDSLPAWAAQISPVLYSLDKFCKEEGGGISRKQACVSFGLGLDTVDKCIIGVNSSIEFDELLTSARHSTNYNLDFSKFAHHNDQLLNPSKWPYKP